MTTLLLCLLFGQSGAFDLAPDSFETKRWIAYLQEERADQTRFALKNAQPYVPRFREIFDEEGTPSDLLWIAMIESSFRKKPTSITGAQGMYQFKAATARHFGLKVEKGQDERNNPYLAARAAAKYLRYLYDKFKDWDLVLAAYNLGEGDLRRAMARRNFTSWSQVQPFVREQTQQFVGKVKAAAIIGNNYMASLPKRTQPEIPTRKVVHEVKKGDTLFGLARYYEVSVDVIKNVNDLRTNHLILGQVLLIPTDAPETKTYRVLKGDTLYAIAKKFQVPVTAIVEANNLKNNAIHTGQVLNIPMGKEP